MQVFNNTYLTLYHADARKLPIPDESIDCVVTSPPYFGLRQYQIDEGVWLGGVEGCDHKGTMLGNNRNFNYREGGSKANNPSLLSNECQYCGAVRDDQGIGLESTPDLYVQNLVKVFREVWRVLKPTGTVWLNLGDSYSSGSRTTTTNDSLRKGTLVNVTRTPVIEGIKPKDLLGMPWRVAFALQADGWYLRSDIIWSKKSPMPESVQDRPTKAHEYIFLLTKNARYYYDTEAIQETTGANKRTVWEIATQPYPEAHFATYPEKLVEPCILAGTSAKGVCAECGKPWERTLTRIDDRHWSERGDYSSQKLQALKATGFRNDGGGAFEGSAYRPTGWQPTCECNAEIVPATVLDPFVGSGTTMAVAQRLNRKGVGTDLSKEYLALASKRLGSITLPMNLGM